MSQNVTRLQEIYRELSADQLRYISARMTCKFDYEAAKIIGISRETVSRWPEKKMIDEALAILEGNRRSLVDEILDRNYSLAAQEIVEELKHRNVNVRYRAAKDLLDRKGINAPAKHEHTGADGDELKIIVEYVNQD